MQLRHHKPHPIVLHVRVVAGRVGGPDKTILRSVAHPNAAPFRAFAAYIHPVGDPIIDSIQEQAKKHNCTVFSIPERGAFDLRTVRQLLDLCRELDVDIWHAHDHKSNALGLLLRRWHEMKLVTTVHGWTDETLRMKLFHRVDHLCLPRYEQIITVSPQLHEECRSLGIPDERLHEISNGVEIEKYQRTLRPETARIRLGLPPHRAMIGYVGRLSREKGVDRAIRLLAELRGVGCIADLHLIGDGPERTKLESLAQELNVGASVRFWGWHTNLHAYYEAMTLMLLTSHTEGLPNVVLEAMAMQVPVAATNVGANSVVLDHGRCGVVLDASELAWVAQVKPLLTNPLLRSQYMRAARSRVESHYTFARRVTREAEIHHRVMGTRAGGASEQRTSPLRKAA